MNTKEAPLVSVITPVYNGAEYIAECVESVLAQTYKNFEYIVVDNCSKDATVEIVRRYAARDQRIILREMTEFVGVIENHNRAFRMMSPESKYCKVVSADDWLYPECLTAMVELSEANPSVGMVGSYSIAGKQVLWDGLEYEKKVVPGHEICRSTLTGGPYVFGSPTSLLYRSDLVRTRKEFYPNSNPHADTSACYQSLEHADFGFVHQVLSYTRVHSDSQTSHSLKSGTINRALISDMAKYGPLYLSEEELKTNLNHRLDKYYVWLAPALLEQSFSRKFIEQQKAGLREIGFELDNARLLKGFAARGVELLREPQASLAKALDRAKRRGKVQARYYQTR
jgi:glycosyltransferase involved in cell wall biosynthesis